MCKTLSTGTAGTYCSVCSIRHKRSVQLLPRMIVHSTVARMPSEERVRTNMKHTRLYGSRQSLPQCAVKGGNWYWHSATSYADGGARILKNPKATPLFKLVGDAVVISTNVHSYAFPLFVIHATKQPLDKIELLGSWASHWYWTRIFPSKERKQKFTWTRWGLEFYRLKLFCPHL